VNRAERSYLELIPSSLCSSLTKRSHDLWGLVLVWRDWYALFPSYLEDDLFFVYIAVTHTVHERFYDNDSRQKH